MHSSPILGGWAVGEQKLVDLCSRAAEGLDLEASTIRHHLYIADGALVDCRLAACSVAACSVTAFG